MKVLGVSEATANVILLSLTLVAIAMSFVWGWLCDRLGPKRTLVVGPRRHGRSGC